jgi:branched-chain amino acid transport system substrate-binding protein
LRSRISTASSAGDVEVIVADDELKPDLAVNKVKALVDRDKVDFVVGPIFPTFSRRS